MEEENVIALSIIFLEYFWRLFSNCWRNLLWQNQKLMLRKIQKAAETETRWCIIQEELFSWHLFLSILTDKSLREGHIIEKAVLQI